MVLELNQNRPARLQTRSHVGLIAHNNDTLTIASMSLIDHIKRPYRLYFRGREWIWFAATVRSRGCHLLKAADHFDRPIFVSGCQRSGTTIATSLISASPDITTSHHGRDEELAGAYVLCGKRKPELPGRYCFQTTYLNECYSEYHRIKSDYSLVWVLRRPESVVYSLVYNWARFPLNELFLSCGLPHLHEDDLERFRRRGIFGLSPLRRACYAYVGKCHHFMELTRSLHADKLITINYEDLIMKPQRVLTGVCGQLDIRIAESSAWAQLRRDTLEKANELTSDERSIIHELCMGSYRDCADLVCEKVIA